MKIQKKLWAIMSFACCAAFLLPAGSLFAENDDDDGGNAAEEPGDFRKKKNPFYKDDGDEEKKTVPSKNKSAKWDRVRNNAKTAVKSDEEDGSSEEQPESQLNPLEVPYLSTYYVQPVVLTNENVVVRFYITDWNQSELRKKDDTQRFNVKITVQKLKTEAAEPEVQELRDIPAGDHELDLGKLSAGEYSISFAGEDMHKRHSNVIFHEFWVREPAEAEISEKETFVVTEALLEKNHISNKGDYGSIIFVDVTGCDAKVVAGMIEDRAKSVKVPSGKYVVVTGGEKYNPPPPIGKRSAARGAKNTAVPEWIPSIRAWRSCKVIYADDYNREKVEEEAVMTGTRLCKLFAAVRERGFRKIVLPKGTYRISNETPLEIPSGLTVDLNGATIKLNQFTGSKGGMIDIADCVDSHVINGIVEGDYFEHDYANSPNSSEWVCGIGMKGEAKYCSYENILVRYITGYGVTNGFDGQNVQAIPVTGMEPGSINRETGEDDPGAPGLAISDPVDVYEFKKKGGYVNVARYLGYQGRAYDEWNVQYHFYDDNMKYLTTIDGWQYRRVRIPEKAGVMRVSVYSASVPSEEPLKAQMFRYPWNSWVKNIFILSARCVGMAPAAMYNHRIENCTFVRCGENLAKCAFDAEDGWDMMQDVWIVRNVFYKNP